MATFCLSSELILINPRLTSDIVDAYLGETFQPVRGNKYTLGLIPEQFLPNVVADIQGSFNGSLDEGHRWFGFSAWFEENYPEPTAPTVPPASRLSVVPTENTMERMARRHQALAAMGVHLPAFHGFGAEGIERNEAQIQSYNRMRQEAEQQPLISTQLETLGTIMDAEDRQDHHCNLGELRFDSDDEGRLWIDVPPIVDEYGVQRRDGARYAVEESALRSLSAAAASSKGNLLPTSWRELASWTANQIASHANLRIMEDSVDRGRSMMYRTRVDAKGVRSLFSFAGPSFKRCDIADIIEALTEYIGDSPGSVTYEANSLSWEVKASKMMAEAPINGEVYAVNIVVRGKDLYGPGGKSPTIEISVTRQLCLNDAYPQNITAMATRRRRVGKIVTRFTGDIASAIAVWERAFPEFKKQVEELAAVPLVAPPSRVAQVPATEGDTDAYAVDVETEDGETTTEWVRDEPRYETPGVFTTAQVEKHRADSKEDLTPLQAAVELAMLTGIGGTDTAAIKKVHRDSIVQMMLNEDADTTEITATVFDVVNGITRHHKLEEAEAVMIPVSKSTDGAIQQQRMVDGKLKEVYVKPADALSLDDLAEVEKAAMPFGARLARSGARRLASVLTR